MSLFTYPILPPSPTVTRMIRLLPDEDNDAPIECKLFNYSLVTEHSDGVHHLYEALSYAWGSDVKSESVILNESPFFVTKNLHAALLCLRDCQLERILWIDALSINQEDGDEKSQQIPLMRRIYAQARCVIVWLGEDRKDSDGVLDYIRHIAEDKVRKDIPADDKVMSVNHAACLELLQQAWFRRIWVLQEVGVARCITVICGSVQINGHAFCEGIGQLKLPTHLQRLIYPVIRLMTGAIFRSIYEVDSRGAHRLSQLIDMYHSHQATNKHDKIYALLGLSSDDPSTRGLKPNYNLPWSEVFKQICAYIFPGSSSVETWPNRQAAIIRVKGTILGQINSAHEVTEEYHHQLIQIIYTDSAQSWHYQSIWGKEWILPTSAASIQEGDLICLLEGASYPSIIRLCRDHFMMIITTAVPQQTESKNLDLGAAHENGTGKLPIYNILLSWEISVDSSRSLDSPQELIELTIRVPEFQESPEEDERRSADMGRIMEEVFRGLLKQGSSRLQAIERLLCQSGANVPITEGLIKTAAAHNEHDAYAIMELLFKSHSRSLPTPEEVVKSAAGNTGPCGYRIMRLLCQRLGTNMCISEEVVVTTARNTGPCGYEIMELLCQHRGISLPISEDVIRAAAGNTGPCGYKIAQLLCQHQGPSLPITEEVVKAAAGNNGDYKNGVEIMNLFYRQEPRSLPISEEVVKAAAGNIGYYGVGAEIIELLLQKLGKSLPISEDVVKIAAGNTGSCGYKIMRLLFEHEGVSRLISEKVVKAAAGNVGNGHEILGLLCRRQGPKIPVSEEVVKEAAENTGPYGYAIMKILCQHLGASLPISERVVKAAADNTGVHGYRMREVLSQHLAASPAVDQRRCR
ncbi:HET-domain-containing protein [Aspergillus floccosus]